MIDIHGGSADPHAARLGNSTTRHFMFDGVACASIEGILQALKEPDVAKQVNICAMSGKAAKQAGAVLNIWKENQTLWWKGFPYGRSSRAYQVLLICIYNAVYEQDPSFRDHLNATLMDDICHSIGNTDQRDTVLTEVEMIHQLNRLRIRSYREPRMPQPKPLINVDVPKYRGVKTDGDPVAFLHLHYASWLERGQLTQLNLRRLDEKLLNALKYCLRQRNEKLASVVPPGIGC